MDSTNFRLSIPGVPFVNFDSVFPAEAPEFVLECFVLMVFLLVCNVFYQTRNMQWTDREGAVARLPIEVV